MDVIACFRMLRLPWSMGSEWVTPLTSSLSTIQLTNATQKRGRRRTTVAPLGTPPVWEKTKGERIDEDNRALLTRVYEAERQRGESRVKANEEKHIEAKSESLGDGQRRVGLMVKKIGMMPQWTNDGTRILCTLLEVPSNHVVSVTSPDDWYRRSMVGKRKAFNRDGPMWKVTVGAGDADPWKFTASYRSQFARAGTGVKEKLGSFLVTENALPQVGIPLDARHFSVGQFVTATGKTIDWGFQGGMHRWGMRGQPQRRTTKSHRRIGSVGSVSDARIWPGKRMPGHMGWEWSTLSGIQIVRMNTEKQVIYVKGNVPGDIGETLLLKDCLQSGKRPKEVAVPTWSPSLETIVEEEAEKEEKSINTDKQIYIDNLFKFTSPSILFSNDDLKKQAGRDKTKAKIAKIYEMTEEESKNESGPSHVHKSDVRRAPTVSATRLPHAVLIHIFHYLQLKDLRSCMTACRHWFNVLSHEDSLVWSGRALLSIPQCALSDSSLLADTKTYKAKLRALAHSWNPKDSSKHNYVRPNLFTMHRHPVAQSTDGIRGKRGVSSGVHAYEITWEGPLGTVAVVGVATKHAALHCPGYVALLGSDDQSWGWNLVDNSLIHNAEHLGVYPRVNNPPKYQVEERIRMIIDCDAKCVYFERCATCEFLGIAFASLPPVKLFPAVCAVYGNTEVSMVYLGPAIMG